MDKTTNKKLYWEVSGCEGLVSVKLMFILYSPCCPFEGVNVNWLF